MGQWADEIVGGLVRMVVAKVENALLIPPEGGL
jgi:hypothetical protein